MSKLDHIRGRFAVQRPPAPEAPCEWGDLWRDIVTDTGSSVSHAVDEAFQLTPGQPVLTVCGMSVTGFGTVRPGKAGEIGCWRCKRRIHQEHDDAG